MSRELLAVWRRLRMCSTLASCQKLITQAAFARGTCIHRIELWGRLWQCNVNNYNWKVNLLMSFMSRVAWVAQLVTNEFLKTLSKHFQSWRKNEERAANPKRLNFDLKRCAFKWKTHQTPKIFSLELLDCACLEAVWDGRGGRKVLGKENNSYHVRVYFLIYFCAIMNAK